MNLNPKYFILPLLIGGSLLFTSCKKNEDKSQVNQPNGSKSVTIEFVSTPVVTAKTLTVKAHVSNTDPAQYRKIGYFTSFTPEMDYTHKSYPYTNVLDSDVTFYCSNLIEGKKYYVQGCVIYQNDTVYSNIIEIQLYGYKGPAGGKVIYDKGVYSDGWRYIEAAPRTSVGDKWGRDTLTGFTFNKNDMGGGYDNTQKLRTLNTNHDWALINYVDTFVCGGYNDWYIPNCAEMNMGCNNCSFPFTIVSTSLWSSVEYDKVWAWCFTTEINQTGGAPKNRPAEMWFMRRF